jgi:cell division protein FtsW
MTARTLLLGGGSPTASARAVALLAAGLSLLGLLIVASLGDGAMAHDGEPYERARRQAAYVVAGAVAALIARGVDYRVLARMAHGILAVTWIALGLLLVLPVKEQLGAKRWFEIPGVGHVQPSEIAKVALVIWCGAYAARRGPRIREFWRGGLPGLAVVGVTAALVLLEKDLGTTLLLCVIGCVSLIVGGARIGHLAPPIAVGAPALIIMMSKKFEYIRDRLDIYRQGFQERNGLGQVDQAVLALGSGGWFGRGFGDARAHLGWVPKSYNDFILAAIGEQLGFVGTAATLVAFVLLFLHGTRIAAGARDRFGFTLAFGAAFVIALQAAVNVAVAAAVVPPKGINLPFVSYGGSSMILLGVCVGLMCSVARVTAAEEAADAAAAEGAADDDATAEPSRAGADSTLIGAAA